jgi:hypothetical protein
MQTTWPPKVCAPGRVLADGLIAEDDTTIDMTSMAMAAMADMDRPHVTLLELLVKHQPVFADEHWASAPCQPGPTAQGGSEQPDSRAWTTAAIRATRDWCQRSWA